MVVAHYIPWRAIRAGKQLSDSKGASAALSTEVAIQSVHRAMDGFIGPKDIFRNPESLFRYFEPTDSHDKSPFDIYLGEKGSDFAVMGMHFKLGLYEHQSAGAIHGLLQMLLQDGKSILDSEDGSSIEKMNITAYEPAFGIIGDPAKRVPTTRQSADHSMVYIISTLLRKALEKREQILGETELEGLFKHLMLTPFDYNQQAIYHPVTRSIMDKIQFKHGGEEYDSKYPEGIPSSVQVSTKDGKELDSGFVMFPGGHSANKSVNLHTVLQHKFKLLGKMAMEKNELIKFVVKLENINEMAAEELENIYDAELSFINRSIDAPALPVEETNK